MEAELVTIGEIRNIEELSEEDVAMLQQLS